MRSPVAHETQTRGTDDQAAHRRLAVRPLRPTPAELGRRIKLLRISRGLTLKDLEERAGSRPPTCRRSSGQGLADGGALGRIARALELRPATLSSRACSRGHRGARRRASHAPGPMGSAVLEAVADPVQGAS